MEKGWLDSPFELQCKRIWIPGHTGLLGHALCKILKRCNAQILTLSRDDLNLLDQNQVQQFMSDKRPDIVIMAAARVGGIADNAAHPAEFLYQNLTIQNHLIHGAYDAGVEKLLFLGSSCIYPKDAQNPIAEDALLTGPLEKTNEAYAIAKIAGLKMVQAYRKQYGCNFISAMPCNLYGPQDHFDRPDAHVIPALIKRMVDAVESGADEFTVWGSGRPRREFLHVDDAADGLLFLLQHYSGALPINMGAGADISIAELAHMLADISGFKGEIIFDPCKPDGVHQKLMDSGRLYSQGWRPKISLRAGLETTYNEYRSSIMNKKEALHAA